MEQPQRPQPRSRLEITSEIFVFEDPARINRTLNRLFWAFFLGSLSIFILSIIITWTMAIKLSRGSAISFGFVILVQRRGHPRAASLLALAAIVVFSLAGVVTGDGIHDAAIVILPVTIALGSLVLGKELFYGLTGLVLAAIVSIGILESRGIITNKYNGLWETGDIAILFLISLMISCAITLFFSLSFDSTASIHESNFIRS